jgi:hypothetical protein
VGEIERQEGIRNPIEAARKLDIPVSDSVGLQRVSDVLSKEIDRADQPLFSETVGTRQRVLCPPPDHVATGQAVGDALTERQRPDQLLPSLARGGGEEEPAGNGRAGHGEIMP